MDVGDLIRGHYGSAGLAATAVNALAAAGVDVSALAPEDLYPVDQLHAGGRAATEHLLTRMNVSPGARLLDVGCGLGGVTRMAAQRGAVVTGIDLTPEFVDAATELTSRCGLGDRAEFIASSAEAIPFEEHSFDAAVLVHVGMNLENKAAVVAEVHRVLRPGARFGLYDQMSAGAGELPYPLPWATGKDGSFVEPPENYVAYLEASGFTIVDVEDRTGAVLAPRPPSTLGPADVLGPAHAEQAGNYVTAARGGLLRAVLIIATAAAGPLVPPGAPLK